MKQYRYGNPDVQTVLIQLVGEHDLPFMEQEIREIKTLTDNADFDMIAVKVDDWNNDLSPWAAPPVFGKEPFGDGAKATLVKSYRALSAEAYTLAATRLPDCSLCGQHIRRMCLAESRQFLRLCGSQGSRNTQ